jgi:hypothetical protein
VIEISLGLESKRIWIAFRITVDGRGIGKQHSAFGDHVVLESNVVIGVVLDAPRWDRAKAKDFFDTGSNVG